MRLQFQSDSRHRGNNPPHLVAVAVDFVAAVVDDVVVDDVVVDVVVVVVVVAVAAVFVDVDDDFDDVDDGLEVIKSL